MCSSDLFIGVKLRIETLARRGWPDARIRNEVLGPEDLTGTWSFGAYSRLNFVRNVRATMDRRP